MFGYCRLIVIGGLFAVPQAMAQNTLTVTLEGLTPAGNLPLSTAFCMPRGSDTKPRDQSPGLHWSAGPLGTKSYVVLMVDPDVTADLSLMNKPGVTIPVDAPRMDIYHWELVDIPADVRRIPPGAEGDAFVPGGKPIGPTRFGVRGTNDYWPYFNNNPKMPASMKGPYGGFDGPCPPSNDLLVHTYRFEVFALDEPSLELTGQFFAPAILKAMAGHILAQGKASARFSFDEGSGSNMPADREPNVSSAYQDSSRATASSESEARAGGLGR